jgi:predicted HAD superfamily Cof-like phosphohydrolase
MIPTKTREEKVKEFRDAGSKLNFIDSPDESDMINDLIFEEFIEFSDAAYDYEQAIEKGFDRVEPAAFATFRQNLVKEWADLQYVVSQAALYYEIPADEAFDRVHNSNMTKVVEGKLRLRDDGKILKPDTYRAPDMSEL